MKYKSTRNSEILRSASEVIAQGISDEGGLFVPVDLPDLTNELSSLSSLSYCDLAEKIFSLFLTDFTPQEVKDCVKNAYTPEKFGGEEPVKLQPLTNNGENKYMLELWHGPTCAFKDMALQILPHFLTASLKKAQPGKKAVILVATSGDTGKAALEGFKDVPGTQVVVFYPQDGVSPMQKRQMATQEGENVSVCAIEGNFDDAQTSIKKIFTDPEMKAALAENNMVFSSANSINWGRLLPQVVYYFYAYFRLFSEGKVKTLGEPINIVVPTGNFGNILAAYYASKMGLPVKKFICASNSNKVLSDFIRTGVYDRRREFYATSSPSMDILVSSNLERLLYAISGEDSATLCGWMEQLAKAGVYDVGPQVLKKMQDSFYGGFCDDKGTDKVIAELLEKEGYLCDTHTAVAVDVYRQYLQDTGDKETPAVIASTASPYKFVQSVLGALEPVTDGNEFENIAKLEGISHTTAPKQLKELQNKPVRFDTVVPRQETAEFVKKTVGIGGC